MILDLPLELTDIICAKIQIKILVDILHKSRLIFTPFFHINKRRLVNCWDKIQNDSIWYGIKIDKDIMVKISDIIWTDRLGH
jgi:hypothetical protein